MPSSHLILCRPLLLLPPVLPSIRVFSNESTSSASLFFFFSNPHFYLFSRSLNSRREQHPTNSVSNGLSRKVASEFGTNHATVSMSLNDLPPDYSGFVRFAAKSYRVVLCFVYISTSLA